MRLLYRPRSGFARGIAARMGRTIFQGIWSQIDDQEPPAPTAPNTDFAKVLGAAVLEAATMAAFAALADRVSAHAFHYLFGIWPGEQPKTKD